MASCHHAVEYFVCSYRPSLYYSSLIKYEIRARLSNGDYSTICRDLSRNYASRICLYLNSTISEGVRHA